MGRALGVLVEPDDDALRISHCQFNPQSTFRNPKLPLMRCDTCQEESPVVMRVVVAKGYNRALARPMFNCPKCFEKKEQSKREKA